MSHTRILTAAFAAAGLLLAVATDAGAQVCMGVPAEEGQISLQGEVASRGTGTTTYGGRLGMNFNTEYALDVSVRRPSTPYGYGTTAFAVIGYEMPRYEPPVCATFGVRYETRPTESGDNRSTTMIPLGLGIGKRLGSAKSLSLAIFARPEYLYTVEPDPPSADDENTDFWHELGDRSEGRGVLGLMLASPFLYATGTVEVETRTDFEPTFSLGLGVTF